MESSFVSDERRDGRPVGVSSIRSRLWGGKENWGRFHGIFDTTKCSDLRIFGFFWKFAIKMTWFIFKDNIFY